MEFQATIGASDKGELFATLLKERVASVCLKLRFSPLCSTHLTQLLTGGEIFKLTTSVTVCTSKQHISSTCGRAGGMRGHLDGNQGTWIESKALSGVSLLLPYTHKTFRMIYEATFTRYTLERSWNLLLELSLRFGTYSPSYNVTDGQSPDMWVGKGRASDM